VATPLTDVYDAFLAKIASDEWDENTPIATLEADWYMILNIAIDRFRYPNISLENDGTNFTEDLTNSEIQILSLFMKSEWLKRQILSWNNIRMLYTDKDFSQANFLDKLIKLDEQVDKECEKQEGLYYRVENHKPTSVYSRLAGGKK
jgi:hypothetical protein